MDSKDPLPEGKFCHLFHSTSRAQDGGTSDLPQNVVRYGLLLGIIAHNFNVITWEAEAGRSL